MHNITIISSDGHACAQMADYRDYLESSFHEDFDAFLVEWEANGSRSYDVSNLEPRLNTQDVECWKSRMLDTGRVDGSWDSARRLKEMEKEGVVAEVLFPDFGLPFELLPPPKRALLGTPPGTPEQKEAGTRAYNRWLVDYVSVAPHRFAGMAMLTFNDVPDTVAAIKKAKESGLKGVLLPEFRLDLPLFHPDFEPVWYALEDHEMVVNSHVGFSSTSNEPIHARGVPHPGLAYRVNRAPIFFKTHNILNHLIWGGVLERHGRLKVVFTEQGSQWTVPELRELDYAYEGSFFRTDIQSVLRCKPSEYFKRQCYLGASIFSRADVEARHEIGLDQMMMGMDFPHHEGTMIESTQDYLRATFGAASVPEGEARAMLGRTAAQVFGFDLDRLEPIAARVRADPGELLSPPQRDLYPLGDVHRPARV